MFGREVEENPLLAYPCNVVERQVTEFFERLVR